jgi:hypothetical protein
VTPAAKTVAAFATAAAVTVPAEAETTPDDVASFDAATAVAAPG